MDESSEKKTQAQKSSVSPILMIGIVLILVGVGMGIYFFINGKEHKKTKFPKEQLITEGASIANAEKVFYFDMPDMLINLLSPHKKDNYLKISISIELENIQTLEKIRIFKPRMIDQFQVFLRSLRMEELKGSTGLEHIREELLRRTNFIVAPNKVTNILFKEILVQ